MIIHYREYFVKEYVWVHWTGMSEKRGGIKIIGSCPPFSKNLKEERTFWDTHDATDYLDDFEEAPDVVFAREKKAVLSLRLESKISRKLREMAIQDYSRRPTPGC